MFDFGFSELILIAMVALIVVGPERLPKVARTAGHMLGRLQRYVSDVKSDIQREMQLEDLKKLQQEVEQQARDIETSVRSQMAKVEADLGTTAAEVRESLAVDAAKASDQSAGQAAPAIAESTPVASAAPARGDRTPAPVAEAAVPAGAAEGDLRPVQEPPGGRQHDAHLDRALDDRPSAPRRDADKP